MYSRYLKNHRQPRQQRTLPVHRTRQAAMIRRSSTACYKGLILITAGGMREQRVKHRTRASSKLPKSRLPTFKFGADSPLGALARSALLDGASTKTNHRRRRALELANFPLVSNASEHEDLISRSPRAKRGVRLLVCGPISKLLNSGTKHYQKNHYSPE